MEQGPAGGPAAAVAAAGVLVPLSESEQQRYSELFSRCCPPPEAAAGGSSVGELFRASQLPPDTLHQVGRGAEGVRRVSEGAARSPQPRGASAVAPSSPRAPCRGGAEELRWERGASGGGPVGLRRGAPLPGRGFHVLPGTLFRGGLYVPSGKKRCRRCVGARRYLTAAGGSGTPLLCPELSARLFVTPRYINPLRTGGSGDASCVFLPSLRCLPAVQTQTAAVPLCFESHRGLRLVWRKRGLPTDPALSPISVSEAYLRSVLKLC